MKKRLKIFAISAFLLAQTFLSLAQQTSPSDPGGNPQTGGDPPLGGGAPIGGGTLILLGLGVAYGGKKFYRLFNEKETSMINLKHTEE